MSQIQKASDRLNARGITHSIIDGSIVLGVWNSDLSEVYDFIISHEEIEYYALEYDNLEYYNQNQQST